MRINFNASLYEMMHHMLLLLLQTLVKLRVDENNKNTNKREKSTLLPVMKIHFILDFFLFFISAFQKVMGQCKYIERRIKNGLKTHLSRDFLASSWCGAIISSIVYSSI